MGQELMFDVIDMVYLRLAKLFAKKGYVDASGEVSVLEDFDSDVPTPFRPLIVEWSPNAYFRKGRLLANPNFQQQIPFMSLESWLNLRYN